MSSYVNSNVYNSQDQRTDQGWTRAASLGNLAMIAVAVYNTLAAIEMNRKQYQIAKAYFDLAKEARDYWNQSYKPCEQNAVAEACSAPLYTPQYDLTSGRYVTSVKIAFKGSLDNLRCVGRYCTGLTAAMLKDITIAEARATADVWNYAYRYEEARKEAKDDVRWNRRMQILSLGRDLIAQSTSYANTAAGIFGTLGQQAVAGAAGAAQSLGYWMNRNEPNYPVGGQIPQGGQPMYQNMPQPPVPEPMQGPAAAPPPDVKIYGFRDSTPSTMVAGGGGTTAWAPYVDGAVPGNSG